MTPNESRIAFDQTVQTIEQARVRAEYLLKKTPAATPTELQNAAAAVDVAIDNHSALIEELENSATLVTARAAAAARTAVAAAVKKAQDQVATAKSKRLSFQGQGVL